LADSKMLRESMLGRKNVSVRDRLEPRVRALSLRTISGFSQLGAATLQNRHASVLL